MEKYDKKKIKNLDKIWMLEMKLKIVTNLATKDHCNIENNSVYIFSTLVRNRGREREREMFSKSKHKKTSIRYAKQMRRCLKQQMWLINVRFVDETNAERNSEEERILKKRLGFCRLSTNIKNKQSDMNEIINNCYILQC